MRSICLFVFERPLLVPKRLHLSQVNLDGSALLISKSLPLTSSSRPPSWSPLSNSQLSSLIRDPHACQDKCTPNLGSLRTPCLQNCNPSNHNQIHPPSSTLPQGYLCFCDWLESLLLWSIPVKKWPQSRDSSALCS